MKSKRLKVVTTINGKLVKRGDDKISVFDNALLYAEGLFETILCIDGRLIFFDDHYRRLVKGTKVMGLKLNVNKTTLNKWAEKTIAAHPNRIIKLRLTVTSGESARYIGVQGKQQIIFSASPHEMIKRPFKLFVSEFGVDQESVFRQIKTVSYVIHAAALKQAKKQKCDDALLLNGKKYVAEVTSANVFWVNNNKVYTTPLNSGCLEGITRIYIINESKKLGYKVIEKNIKLADLVKADEVFISSSLKLVKPISQIKTIKKTYNLKSGPIAKQLHERFLKIVKF